MVERFVRRGMAVALAWGCLAVVGSPCTLYAEPPRWTRIGPDGGTITALAAAPSRPALVYAGLRMGGVFRSTDAGRTWAFAGRQLQSHQRIAALAVDAKLPKRVWAATSTGLFSSTDGGDSWSPVRFRNAIGPGATTVAADPRRSGTVYVSLAGKPLFKTTDAGSTWQSLGAGAPQDVAVLVIDPLHPDNLYAGAGAGLFRSTDAGAHWTAAERGLPAPLPGIVALAVDPRIPQTLFLATADGGLWKSADGAAHWAESGSGVPGGLPLRAIAVDPAASSRVYAAAPGGGVFRSTDGGRTWRTASAGLPDLSGTALAVTRWGVMAAIHHGVFTSADHALTWQPGRGIAASSIRSLAIDRLDPRLYAYDPSLGLFKTASGGATWLALPLPAGADPGSGRIAAGGPPESDGLIVYFASAGAVARSDNGGRRWSTAAAIPCVVPDRFTLDPADSDVFYVSGFVDLRSCAPQARDCLSFKVDHGQVSCLRDDAIDAHGVPVLAIDPAAPDHLFAAGTYDLFHSVDGGATWTLLSPGLQAYLLAFDPTDSSKLYAAVYPIGIARSTDGGATWEIETGNGLPSSFPLKALQVDFLHPSTLYAAWAGDVLVSEDSGTTWTPAGTGLESVLVTGLVLNPDAPSNLFAATQGGGVMMLQR